MPLLPFLLIAQAPDLKAPTIDALFASMRKQYVFPETAAKAEAAVRANLADKKYDGLEGKDFADRLTTDLQAVCKDAHLRVRYSEKPLPARKDADQPSPEEIAKNERFVRLANAGFEKVERLPGNVGYIRLENFHDPEAAKEPMRAAMAFVANTDALIFDIRTNGGGDPETVRQLCSYLFEKPTHINSLYWRPDDKTTDFWTTETVPGKRYLGRDIYVLVSKRTGSGAEEFAYDLQTQKRATLVGESTWGGANPGHVVRLNDHYQAFVPTGRAINPITKTNWEGTGVIPDVKVPQADALKEAQKMAIERLLAKAADADEKARLEDALKFVKAS